MFSLITQGTSEISLFPNAYMLQQKKKKLAWIIVSKFMLMIMAEIWSTFDIENYVNKSKTLLVAQRPQDAITGLSGQVQSA